MKEHQQLIDDLKCRINPAYANTLGTESHERRQCVEALESLSSDRHQLISSVERCYRMLLTEPDTKGALFKAENILREALADQKVGSGDTAGKS